MLGGFATHIISALISAYFIAFAKALRVMLMIFLFTVTIIMVQVNTRLHTLNSSTQLNNA